MPLGNGLDVNRWRPVRIFYFGARPEPQTRARSAVRDANQHMRPLRDRRTNKSTQTGSPPAGQRLG